MKSRLITAAAAAAALLAGCAANSTYQQRMDYLRVVAQRGAETHALLEAQGATIDKKRCEAAFRGLDDGQRPDSGSDGGDYANQVQQFFVDSCISGRPKPVPGQPAPSTSVTVPVSPAPASSR